MKNTLVLAVSRETWITRQALRVLRTTQVVRGHNLSQKKEPSDLCRTLQRLFMLL